MQRMFILLDQRKVSTIPMDASDREEAVHNSKQLLIALKYFDIFTQTHAALDTIVLSSALNYQNWLGFASKMVRFYSKNWLGFAQKTG